MGSVSSRMLTVALVGAVAAVVLTFSGPENAGAVPQKAADDPGGSTWGDSATTFRGRNGARFLYTCPSYGSPGSVWGTDVYTDDSSVCTAAVHAGRITLASGGYVTIEIRPGQDSYDGTSRNGIDSSDWGRWSGSYVVVGATGPGPGLGVGGAGWTVTAATFRSRVGERFVYTCPANGTAGSVWGTNVYTDDSSVCTAGVHAGRITLAAGGSVTVEIRDGQDSYDGTVRNGISSSDYGAWAGSFFVVGAPASGPPTAEAKGTVLVNGRPFSDGVVPYGANVDVTKGTLDMTTEAGPLSVFGAGGLSAKFKLVRATMRASGKTVPVVELRLTGGNFASCGRALAGSSAKGKPIRRLWGKGKGRFRSKGRHSSASVKGTLWLTEDRCDGTWTFVKEGVVSVRDNVRKKTINVRAPRGYLAKPRR